MTNASSPEQPLSSVLENAADDERPVRFAGAPTPRERTPHPYVGMWTTADSRVRHELLADGRYVEARGSREAAYTGRYVVDGNHIDYVDDTGFTADGDFVGGVLHHGGMILRRES